ncbi:Protein Brevis radix-like 4 [Glycine soja]|nr:Protein Brevis radix-like 4 [Glycine soja]
MLTCIARPKKPDESDPDNATSAAKSQAIKSLTSQIRDMALKASGAYKHCAPCTGPATQGRVRSNATELDADSDRFRWSYRRTRSSISTTTRTWGKEMKARLKGISSGEGISPIKASHQVVHPIHAEVPVFSHHIGTRSSGSGVRVVATWRERSQAYTVQQWCGCFRWRWGFGSDGECECWVMIGRCLDRLDSDDDNECLLLHLTSRVAFASAYAS